MPRLLLATASGMLLGVGLWFAVGFTAAQILSRSGGGQSGGEAMAAFFAIGPVGGLVGFAAGAWLVWRLLADPSRSGVVGAGLCGVVLLEMVVLAVVLAGPRREAPQDFPAGKRGELQLEARFPKGRIQALGKRDVISFELRAGGFFLEAPWQKDRIREEDGQSVVPGAIRLEERVGTKILGVMAGEKQIDAVTIEMLETPDASTEWTDWKPIEGGAAVRWRLAVIPK